MYHQNVFNFIYEDSMNYMVAPFSLLELNRHYFWVIQLWCFLSRHNFGCIKQLDRHIESCGLLHEHYTKRVGSSFSSQFRCNLSSIRRPPDWRVGTPRWLTPLEGSYPEFYVVTKAIWPEIWAYVFFLLRTFWMVFERCLPLLAKLHRDDHIVFFDIFLSIFGVLMWRTIWCILFTIGFAVQ